MKKILLFLSILTLILSACGIASTPTEEAVTVQDITAIAEIVSGTQTAVAPVIANTAISKASTSLLSTEYANAAPAEIQLLVGILKLEGTDLIITPSQATSLLTLLNSLKGNSATQEQVTSIIQQAQAILSAHQITAIANMQITQESAMTIMQEQGLGMGGQGQGNGNQPPQAGDMPQGTPPSQPGGQGQPPDASQMGTPPADGTQSNRGLFPPQLLDLLIQYLETKAAS